MYLVQSLIQDFHHFISFYNVFLNTFPFQCLVLTCSEGKERLSWVLINKDFQEKFNTIDYTIGLLRNRDVTIVVSELRLRITELVADGLLVCFVWCLCLDYSVWNLHELFKNFL